MEQATAGAATSLLAQLGIAGIGVLLIASIAFWWLRASKDLREEKEGVIARLGADKDRLKQELKDAHTETRAAEAEADRYKGLWLKCQYPQFEEGDQP